MRLSNAYTSVLGVSVYTFSRRHQRTSTRARNCSSAKAGSAQDAGQTEFFVPVSLLQSRSPDIPMHRKPTAQSPSIGIIMQSTLPIDFIPIDS